MTDEMISLRTLIEAVGVNSDGRREVLGIDIGASEAEAFWAAFLRKLRQRGLRGVKLAPLGKSPQRQPAGPGRLRARSSAPHPGPGVAARPPA